MPILNQIVTYNSSYTPSNATTPVTNVWSITPSDAGTISPNNTASSVSIQWTRTGTHTLQLTSTNCGATRSFSNQIVVTGVTPGYNKCNNILGWNASTRVCNGNSTTIGVSVNNNNGEAIEFSINGGIYQPANAGNNGYSYTASSTGLSVYFDARIIGCTTNILNGLVVSCDPVSTPTVTPVSTPVVTPSTSPVSTPVSTPTTTPVSTPVSTPVAVPTTSPVATPVSTPVSTPVATPVSTPVASCNYYSIQNASSNTYNYTYPTVNGTLSGTLLGNSTVNICTSEGVQSIRQTNTSAPIVTLQGVTLIGTSTCSCSSSPVATPVAAPTTSPVATPVAAPVAINGYQYNVTVCSSGGTSTIVASSSNLVIGNVYSESTGNGNIRECYTITSSATGVSTSGATFNLISSCGNTQRCITL